MQSIVITYRPLITGNVFHTKRLTVNQNQLHGMILMSQLLRPKDITIQFDNYLPPLGNYYHAKFVQSKVSFNNLEVVQGAVQVCIFFGTDPSSVITDINGIDMQLDFGRYYSLIDLENKSPFPNGTPVGLNYINIPTKLSKSLKKTLVQCFNVKNVGIIVPGVLYYISQDKDMNQVIASCVISSNLPQELGHYTGANYISNVCSDPNFTGQGLGKSNMVSMLNSSLQQGMTRFVLEVKPDNKTAYKLYTDLGFIKVETTKHEGLLYDVLLLSL